MRTLRYALKDFLEAAFLGNTANHELPRFAAEAGSGKDVVMIGDSSRPD